MSPPSTQSESHYEADAAQKPIPGALLVFSATAPQLRPVSLRGGTVVIGREDAGGVALPDERVSRQHCELSFDGRFTVKDLGSRNGTWLNGVKVEGSQHASSGDVVRLAQSIFLLCDDLRRFLAGAVVSGAAVIGPSSRSVLDQIAVGGRGSATVLITGESGAGKELAARAFHEAAAKTGAFVAVNCAAIPSTVAERLLFGAVKGAYSDAKADVPGYVQTADGGVLFLDELGELDLQVQAKLLRVVETNEVLPLGASTPRAVKLRICSATHRDLRAAIEAGTFRADLFYRLAQLEVRLPPLRERREEISWLLAHALGEQPIHPSLVELALLRPWPGNARELINQAKKAGGAAVVAKSASVRAEHLDVSAGMPTALSSPAAGPTRAESSPTRAPSPAAPLTLGKDQIATALAAHANNVAAAARSLGLHRTQLYRLMKRHGLAGDLPMPPDAD